MVVRVEVMVAMVGYVIPWLEDVEESKNACGEVGGVEKMSSTGSKFMVKGDECLEGCVGAGGGDVWYAV
ncbi:hypothetical protein Tco_0744497 [Tanacetum coccineum]